MSDHGRDHIDQLRAALDALVSDVEVIEKWANDLAGRLVRGQRVLTLGNGGSATQAQHLSAELVGRYGAERQPLSAIALTADTATLTAIANDYGAPLAFARQVRAHARQGDVVIALSTSGRSPNVLAAIDAARDMGVDTWALTGPRPNPVADSSDEAIACASSVTATVQELHLVCIHLLCAFVDTAIAGCARPVSPS